MKIQIFLLSIILLSSVNSQPNPTFADLQTFMTAFSAELGFKISPADVNCFNKSLLYTEFFNLEVQELGYVNSTYEGTGFAEINLLIHGILGALKPAFKCLLSNGWDDFVSALGLNSTYNDQTNLENLMYNYGTAYVNYSRNALVEYNNYYNASNFTACGTIAGQVFRNMAIAASSQNAPQTAVLSFLVELWSTPGIIYSESLIECFNQSIGSAFSFYNFIQGWAQAVKNSEVDELAANIDSYFASAGLVNYQGALSAFVCFNQTQDSEEFVKRAGYSWDPYSYTFQRNLGNALRKDGRNFRSGMLPVIAELSILSANTVGESLGMIYQMLMNYGEVYEYI